MVQMDMSQEKAPVRKKLMPEGWRKLTIIECEPSVSKGGNDMFIITWRDQETGYEEKVYAVATQGKRWFLKTILTACGIPAGKDGIYDWNTSDIIGKEIIGLFEHEPNEYINRNGETVKTTQHRLTEVKSITEADEHIEWDKDK